MKTKFLTTKSLMKEVNTLSLLLIILTVVAVIPIAASIPLAQFTLLIISIFVVHELAHLIFIKLYKIKWKPVITLLVIGYKNIGGKLTINQWLLVSLSGFLSTLTFLFFYPQLLLLLVLLAMGDFYISAKILMEGAVSMRFYPGGTLLYLK